MLSSTRLNAKVRVQGLEPWTNGLKVTMKNAIFPAKNAVFCDFLKIP